MLSIFKDNYIRICDALLLDFVIEVLIHGQGVEMHFSLRKIL